MAKEVLGAAARAFLALCLNFEAATLGTVFEQLKFIIFRVYSCVATDEKNIKCS